MTMHADVAAVLAGESRWAAVPSDCITFMDSLPEDSVSLVFGSPPYLDARTYGVDAVYGCQEWVEWMLRATEAAVRVSKGLVLWVCAGVQRKGCYWPGCEGLAWEWWKRGNQLWRPCIWWKVDEDEGGSGIPGSGGKQWLRNDWEYILAFKKEGWLPWADPLVMGHEPVVEEVGGQMSNRTADGRRINEGVARAGLSRGQRWGGATRSADGEMQPGSKDNARSRAQGWNAEGSNRRKNGKRKKVKRDEVMPPGPVHDGDGNIVRAAGRPFPKVANPGNVLPIVVKARVGGGHMGSRLCHENEAPFPEKLAEFFVRSFCPPGGVVLDCFAGSGTTAAVSVRHGRRFVGCDLRESQIELTRRRVGGETWPMFAEEMQEEQS